MEKLIFGILIAVFVVWAARFLYGIARGDTRRDESKRNQKLRARAQKGFGDY
jgi:hypothetical protein